MEDLLNIQYAQRLLLEDKQESRIRAMHTITTRVEMIFRNDKIDESFKRLEKEVEKIKIDYINVTAALYRRTGLFILRAIIRGIPQSSFCSTAETSSPPASTAVETYCLEFNKFMEVCVPVFLNSIGDNESKVRLAAVEGCHELLRRMKLYVVSSFFFDLLCALANSIHDRDRQVASLTDDVSSIMREIIRGDASFVVNYELFLKFVRIVLESHNHRCFTTAEDKRVVMWVLDWIWFLLDLPNSHIICYLPSYLSMLLQLSETTATNTNYNNEADRNTYNHANSTSNNNSSSSNNKIGSSDIKSSVNVANASPENHYNATGVTSLTITTHNNSTSNVNNAEYTNLLYKVIRECRLQTRIILLRQASCETAVQDRKEEDCITEEENINNNNNNNNNNIFINVDSKNLEIPSETSAHYNFRNFDVTKLLSILINTVSHTKHAYTQQVCIWWMHELYQLVPFKLLTLLPDVLVKCIFPLEESHNTVTHNAIKELESLAQSLICHFTMENVSTCTTENVICKERVGNCSLHFKKELLLQIASTLIDSIAQTTENQGEQDNVEELIDNGDDKKDASRFDVLQTDNVSAASNYHDNSSSSSSSRSDNKKDSSNFDKRVTLVCENCTLREKSKSYLIAALEWFKLLHHCDPVTMQELTAELINCTMHLLIHSSEEVMYDYIAVLCIWSGTSSFDACLEHIFYSMLGKEERKTSLLLTRLPSILKRLQMFYEDAFASECEFSCTKVLCKVAELLLSSCVQKNKRWHCKVVILCQALLLTSNEFANVRQLLRKHRKYVGMVPCKESNEQLPNNFDDIETMNEWSSYHYHYYYSEAHKVFDVLFRSWCVNAVSVLGLCLVANEFALAWKICTVIGNSEVSSSTLLQLDRLVQLFESPVFTWLRSLLVSPECCYDVHDTTPSIHVNSVNDNSLCCLVNCFYTILAILPQSSPQYRALYTRLKLTRLIRRSPLADSTLLTNAQAITQSKIDNDSNHDNKESSHHNINKNRQETELSFLSETKEYFKLFVKAQQEIVAYEKNTFESCVNNSK